MNETIVNQEGCPKIAGTRITIYDVMDYVENGWTDQGTAYVLGLKREQVAAAREYIAQHREHVMGVYRRILERDAAGNPPELQARLDASHKRLQEMIRERRLAKEAKGAGSGGGC